MRFTDIAIRALLAPESGQRDFWDDSLRGFGLRVSQGGTKSFVLLQNGNRRTLGRFPQLSLAQARSEARKLLAHMELGRTFSSNATFSEALDDYITQHVKKNTKASTAYQVERSLRHHFPFGSKRLDALQSRDLMGIIDALPPSAANHAFAYARAFLRWCVRRRLIDRSPLDNLPLPNKPRSRERVLSPEELAAVFRAAQQFPFPFGHIVLLLILTGQRVGEISALRWDYIDFEQGLVTLPAAIVKNNTTHVFPLGDTARGVILDIERTGDFVFPSTTGTKGYDGHNKAKTRFDAACPLLHWTLHDLRRTFSTLHARIGTQPHVTEALLNHKTGTRSPIQRIYDRHTYLPEMRAALKNYEAHIASIVHT